jgi:hypothetical protein
VHARFRFVLKRACTARFRGPGPLPALTLQLSGLAGCMGFWLRRARGVWAVRMTCVKELWVMRLNRQISDFVIVITQR